MFMFGSLSGALAIEKGISSPRGLVKFIYCPALNLKDAGHKKFRTITSPNFLLLTSFNFFSVHLSWRRKILRSSWYLLICQT